MCKYLRQSQIFLNSYFREKAVNRQLDCIWLYMQICISWSKTLKSALGAWGLLIAAEKAFNATPDLLAGLNGVGGEGRGWKRD